MRRRRGGIPAQCCLFAWAMRGHHPPPDPTVLSEADLAATGALRGRPGPARRWMTEALGRVVREVILRQADRWGARVHEVLIGRTCVYARVDVQDCFDEWSFGPAVNLIATRRARRELGWPRDERVFTRRGRAWQLPTFDPTPEPLGRRYPGLALL